jgi:hypothetical protein
VFQGNPFTLANGRDPGHTGMVIFNSVGAFSHIVGDFLNWVTFDFYFENTQKLTFAGGTGSSWAILGWSDPDTNDSIGFILKGAIFASSGLVLYDSRKTEIGYCIFNSTGTKRTGGPGWCLGIGRFDTTGFGNNSLHHCTFNLFYIHNVDANGDNGDDAIANIGAIDIHDNNFIPTLTTGFAGGNHQDGIQSDGRYVRIYNNYFQNLANYCIFGEF